MMPHGLELCVQRRDFDEFDEVCDHLLVLDRRRGEGPEGIVGKANRDGHGLLWKGSQAYQQIADRAIHKGWPDV